jgi:hypothetical protein
MTPKIMALFPDLSLLPCIYASYPIVALKTVKKLVCDHQKEADPREMSVRSSNFWKAASLTYAEDLSGATLGILLTVQPVCTCCHTLKIPCFLFRKEARMINAQRYNFILTILDYLGSADFLRPHTEPRRYAGLSPNAPLKEAMDKLYTSFNNKGKNADGTWQDIALNHIQSCSRHWSISVSRLKIWLIPRLMKSTQHLLPSLKPDLPRMISSR